MRRRPSVTQQALDELGAPAAMEPPCPTVSNVDVETVGDSWHSSSPFGCWKKKTCALKEFKACHEFIVSLGRRERRFWCTSSRGCAGEKDGCLQKKV